MRVLLLSTYELGRQPFGLASPAAWLRDDGFDVEAVDLSRTRLDPAAVTAADLVAVFLPMHTATRLALPVIDRVRALHPSGHLCAYGLYAPANRALLEAHGVATILGAEFEADLLAVARALAGGSRVEAPAARASLPRLAFRTPDRRGLPPPDRYAAMVFPDGTSRVSGYTEASRGCKHRCRHCPVVPVYDGRFRVLPLDVILADIRAQVDAGARHITFGDPDFFNGIAHARRVVAAVAAAFPGLTYDVTIKIEHLLAHASDLDLLARTGCAMVTSAVESFDDDVLRRLEKGHTRADVERAVGLTRAAGLPLVPTFVAFTPWTTREAYLDLLDSVEALDLVDHVAPVQWTIRLLIPNGSRLLELPDVRELVGPFDSQALVYPWTHPDPRMDALQRDAAAVIGSRLDVDRRSAFERVRALACAADDDEGPALPDPPVRTARVTVPYLTEPWYC